MEVFDKVSQQTLDRRDRQLSILALVMVIILGGGMALLMYPMVFGKAAVIPVAPSQDPLLRLLRAVHPHGGVSGQPDVRGPEPPRQPHRGTRTIGAGPATVKRRVAGNIDGIQPLSGPADHGLPPRCPDQRAALSPPGARKPFKDFRPRSASAGGLGRCRQSPQPQAAHGRFALPAVF